MKTKNALLVSFVLFLSLTAFSQMVYDQSFRDLSFVKFKNQLTESVLDKDTALLFSLLAQEVHFSDNGCSHAPKNCVMNEFRRGGLDAEKLWDDLLKALSFGFSHTVLKDGAYSIAEKGEVIFQAPAYLKSFDSRNSQYALVLGQNVNIRDKPTQYSKTLAQASFESLKYDDPMVTGSRSDFFFTDGKQWYRVTLRDGRIGYIMEDYLSASLSRELTVKKVNGEWKIVSFYSAVPKC